VNNKNSKWWDVLYFRVTKLNTESLRTIFDIQISAYFHTQNPLQTHNEKNILTRGEITQIVLKEEF